MFAKMTSRFVLGAIVALTLGGGAASAQTSEVSGLKVIGEAPTSITLNVTGLQRPAVLHLVRVAALQVCGNAVRNRELGYFDGDWCVGATIDRTMDRFHRLRSAAPRQLAFGPSTLVIAMR